MEGEEGEKGTGKGSRVSHLFNLTLTNDYTPNRPRKRAEFFIPWVPGYGTVYHLLGLPAAYH